METLPPELVQMIASYLRPTDVINLRQVSTTLASKAANLPDQQEHEVCVHKGDRLASCGHAGCGAIEYTEGNKDVILANIIMFGNYDEYRKYLRLIKTDLDTFQKAIEILPTVGGSDLEILRSLIDSSYSNLIDVDKLMELGGVELIPIFRYDHTELIFRYFINHDNIKGMLKYINHLDLYKLYQYAYLYGEYPMLHRYLIFDLNTISADQTDFITYYAISFLDHQDCLKHLERIDLNEVTDVIDRYRDHYRYLLKDHNRTNIDYLLDNKISIDYEYIFTCLGNIYAIVLRDRYHLEDAIEEAFRFSINNKDYDDMVEILTSENLDELTALRMIYNYDYHYLYMVEQQYRFKVQTYIDLYNTDHDDRLIETAFVASYEFVKFVKAIGIDDAKLGSILYRPARYASDGIPANIEYILGLEINLSNDMLKYIIRVSSTNYLADLYELGYDHIYDIYADLLIPSKYESLLEILGGDNDFPILQAILRYPNMLKYLANKYQFSQQMIEDPLIIDEVNEVYQTLPDKQRKIYLKIWGDLIGVQEYQSNNVFDDLSGYSDVDDDNLLDYESAYM